MHMAHEVLPAQLVHHRFRQRLVKTERRQRMPARLRPPGMPTGDIDAMRRHQRANPPNYTRLVIAAHNEQMPARLEVNAVFINLQDVWLLPVEQGAGDANLLAIAQSNLASDDITVVADFDAFGLRDLPAALSRQQRRVHITNFLAQDRA